MSLISKTLSIVVDGVFQFIVVGVIIAQNFSNCNRVCKNSYNYLSYIKKHHPEGWCFVLFPHHGGFVFQYAHVVSLLGV
jgi:hypothetical protein